MDQEPDQFVERAKAGEAGALDALVRHSQSRVHRLALRMLADPELALDATQEILIRVITKLSTFRGDSSFDTWVYRIAVNYLLTARKVAAHDPGLSFEMFGADLEDGLVDEAAAAPEDHIMLTDLRVKCTMAMLLCLDRDNRAAYVLGDILELDHREAADVLDITAANFRKRLSRARGKVVAFTARSCGLANKQAACSCPKRLPAAMAAGRVGAGGRPEISGAPGYSDVRRMAAETNAELLVAKLQKATGPLLPPRDLAADILKIVDPPG